MGSEDRNLSFTGPGNQDTSGTSNSSPDESEDNSTGSENTDSLERGKTPDSSIQPFGDNLSTTDRSLMAFFEQMQNRGESQSSKLRLASW